MIDETVLIENASGRRYRVPLAELSFCPLQPGERLVLTSNRRDDPPPPLPKIEVVEQAMNVTDADGNTLNISVNLDVDPVTRQAPHVRYLITDEEGCRKTYYAAPDQALAIARAVVKALEEQA